MKVTIIKDERAKNGWVKFETDDPKFFGSAKVYNEGDGAEDPNDYMGYGVRIGSRVSKLTIYDSESTLRYDWDRGEGRNTLDAEWVVDEIDEVLNELPII